MIQNVYFRDPTKLRFITFTCYFFFQNVLCLWFMIMLNVLLTSKRAIQHLKLPQNLINFHSQRGVNRGCNSKLTVNENMTKYHGDERVKPCTAELSVSIFHSFEVGIANAISSFK